MMKANVAPSGLNRGPTPARRGAMVVLIAFLLPVLLILVGFSIDLALMQSVRTEMRAVADLSAKAAVGELSRTQNIGQARAAARQVAIANDVAGCSITLEDADIVFGRSVRQGNGKWSFQSDALPLNSVRVNVRRTAGGSNGPVALYFGRLYGRPVFEPTMAATASFLDVDICLVLDRSSSMKLSTLSLDGLMSGSDPRFCDVPWPDSRWVALQDAIASFLGHLTSTIAIEHCALVTFSSDFTSSCGETNQEATVDQALGSNLTLVNQAMSARTNMVWNGMTNIDAGIRVGRGVLTGAGSRTYAEKIMIVLTDGVFTGANPITEAVAAANDGITVHTITYGAGANQPDMQAVAAAANGDHYHAPSASALMDVFRDISGSISVLTQ